MDSFLKIRIIFNVPDVLGLEFYHNIGAKYYYKLNRLAKPFVFICKK